MTISGGSTSIAMRRSAAAAGQQQQTAAAAAVAIRMNITVLVRILFQYLERVDKDVLALAREILKDCERKQASRDSQYKTLNDAISVRIRATVGESHWNQARKIQKQLVANQQKKRLMCMKQQGKSRRSISSKNKGLQAKSSIFSKLEVNTSHRDRRVSKDSDNEMSVDKD